MTARTFIAPPQANRQKLLAQLEGIFDPRLRKQCFVIAVDIALSSDGANDAEDAFVEQLKRALRIDDKFARQTIEVFGAKYACARD